MIQERPLVTLLCLYLGEEQPVMEDQLDDLERQLARRIDQARNAWPDVVLSNTVFIPFLAERLSKDTSPLDRLSHLRVTDLYLTCACALGDVHALRHFDTHLRGQLERCLARFNPSDDFVDEVRQEIRRQLLVSAGASMPGIIKYFGKSRLDTWLWVSARRLGARLLAKDKRYVHEDDQLLQMISEDTGDPELQYLKQFSRDKFRRAFLKALDSLSSRERNLLRLHTLDQMSINEMGRIFNIHRVTAARWLDNVRKTLAERTREQMVDDLDISEGEYDSIMRMLQTRLDVTISRYLNEPSFEQNGVG